MQLMLKKHFHLVDLEFLINSKFLETSGPCLATAANHSQTKEERRTKIKWSILYRLITKKLHYKSSWFVCRKYLQIGIDLNKGNLN